MGGYGKPFTDLLGSRAIQRFWFSSGAVRREGVIVRAVFLFPSQPTAESWGCCLYSGPHTVVSLETSDTGSEAASDSVRQGPWYTGSQFDSKLVLIYFPNTHSSERLEEIL